MTINETEGFNKEICLTRIRYEGFLCRDPHRFHLYEIHW
jgi:hypothetical protein